MHPSTMSAVSLFCLGALGINAFEFDNPHAVAIRDVSSQIGGALVESAAGLLIAVFMNYDADSIPRPHASSSPKICPSMARIALS